MLLPLWVFLGCFILLVLPIKWFLDKASEELSARKRLMVRRITESDEFMIASLPTPFLRRITETFIITFAIASLIALLVWAFNSHWDHIIQGWLWLGMSISIISSILALGLSTQLTDYLGEQSSTSHRYVYPPAHRGWKSLEFVIYFVVFTICVVGSGVGLYYGLYNLDMMIGFGIGLSFLLLLVIVGFVHDLTTNEGQS